MEINHQLLYLVDIAGMSFPDCFFEFDWTHFTVSSRYDICLPFSCLLICHVLLKKKDFTIEAYLCTLFPPHQFVSQKTKILRDNN